MGDFETPLPAFFTLFTHILHVSRDVCRWKIGIGTDNTTIFDQLGEIHKGSNEKQMSGLVMDDYETLRPARFQEFSHFSPFLPTFCMCPEVSHGPRN